LTVDRLGELTINLMN